MTNRQRGGGGSGPVGRGEARDATPFTLRNAGVASRAGGGFAPSPPGDSRRQWALKEWAAVCDALDRGLQIVLLRKGGIAEARGEFAVEHPEFFLYPTREHQRAEHLQSRFREALADAFRAPADPRVPIRNFARVEGVLEAGDLAKLQALRERYVWTPEHVARRHAYKPSKPMFVLLLRVFRLPEARPVAETPRYAGCKSWVDFDEPLDPGGARPVLDDARFRAEVEAVSRGLA